MYLKRSDLQRPNRPKFIMRLLNNGRHRSTHANSITAHYCWLGFTVLSQELTTHGLCIFSAELKDVSNFNATIYSQGAFTFRAWIATTNGGNIASYRLL